VSDDGACEPPIDAFIKQDLHETVSRRRSFAS
jgi:hypothetical protein